MANRLDVEIQKIGCPCCGCPDTNSYGLCKCCGLSPEVAARSPKKLCRKCGCITLYADGCRSQICRPASRAVKVPLCPICKGYGYTGAPEAHLPADHPVYPGGDFIWIALSRGVACSCSVGAQFSQQQAEYFGNYILDSRKGVIYN
jgi:hypothetical protein